ncbi:MAG: sigma 54-interacting transcriptional regulator [Myxococcaceae bacterium]|nr:sigma 54-interacting transcriptional regulator [Myxococcaceae bacterium]
MRTHDITQRDSAGGPGFTGRLKLLLVDGDSVTARVLPEQGSVLLGRGAEADLRLELPRVSRQHARLWLGPPLMLEDLGSANGTKVRGRTLKAGERVTLEPGDGFELGSVLLLVQPERVAGAEAARPRRLASPDYFDTRLEEECERAEAAGGTPFGLLRIALPGDPLEAAAKVAAVLRSSDVLGRDAKGLQALVAGATLERISALAAQVSAVVPGAEVGRASWPESARSPAALYAAAAPGGSSDVHDEAPVVEDPAMRALYAQVRRVAASDLTVLLLGETGVGKEVVSRTVHKSSPRAKGPFVAINCGALSPTLLESELFGHVKGAFTGAAKSRVGLLEAAKGGTCFLDELGEMPPATQVKLLRALEEREVTPVGATEPKKIDVRFVAATHRDLAADVESGRFRADLYFRLNGVSIEIPALRERPGELEALARRFAERAGRKLGKKAMAVDDAALALLKGYAWPGNIRELRNVIDRAVLLAPDDVITPDELPAEKLAAVPVTDEVPAEKQRVLDALEKCCGNQTLAAKVLGISRRTLVTRIETFGLPRPRKGARKRVGLEGELD